ASSTWTSPSRPTRLRSCSCPTASAATSSRENTTSPPLFRRQTVPAVLHSPPSRSSLTIHDLRPVQGVISGKKGWFGRRFGGAVGALFSDPFARKHRPDRRLQKTTLDRAFYSPPKLTIAFSTFAWGSSHFGKTSSKSR